MNSKKNLANLQLDIKNFCDERDWSQFHNLKDLSISLSLEAAEVLEHFQWLNSKEMASLGEEKSEKIGEELADVFYWILLIANKLNIDLLSAFENKMMINKTKYSVSKSKSNHKKYNELK